MEQGYLPSDNLIKKQSSAPNMSNRRFSDSEVLAHTQNRREEKNLNQTIIKLTDDRGLYSEEIDKERKNVIEFRKLSRRSTGNTVFSNDTISRNFDTSMMNRFSRPWALTLQETTHNIMYREISSANLAQTSLVYKRLINKTGVRSASTSRKSTAMFRKSSSMPPLSRMGTSLGPMSRASTSLFPMSRASTSLVPMSRMSTKPAIDAEDKTDVSKISYNETDNGNGRLVSSTTRRPRLVFTDDIEHCVESNIVNLTRASAKHTSFSIPLLGTEDRRNVTETESYSLDNEKDATENKNEQLFDSTYKDNHDNVFDTSIESPHHGISDSYGDNIDNAKFRERETLAIKLKLPTLPRADLDSPIDQALINKINSRAEPRRLAPKPTATSRVSSTTLSRDQGIVRQGSAEGVAETVNSEIVVKTDSKTADTVSEHKTQDEHVSDGMDVDRSYTAVQGDVLEYKQVVDHGSPYILHKGQRIHNYVPPQQRYKKDPYKMQRRERLIAKIGKDHPDWADKQKVSKASASDCKFSKASRDRLHEKLVRQNSVIEDGQKQYQHAVNYVDKISVFLNSIDYLRKGTDHRSRSRHPLLA